MQTYIPPQTGKEKLDLLPPSAFQDTCGDDAWKELARATNEVMNLKLENQKLRYVAILCCFFKRPIAFLISGMTHNV